MWRCICGHAFYSALPPSCPSCDRVVDADVEETVTVDGRKLPFRVWEAEVLVRAAGWAAILRGCGLLVGAAVATPRWPYHGIAPTTVGLLLVWTGANAFRRGRPSRWILVAQSMMVSALLTFTGTMLGARHSEPVYTYAGLTAVAGQAATDIFILLVVLSTAGDWVWEMVGPGEPIASLASAWRIGRSLKAWASLGVLCLAVLSSGLLAWLVARWIYVGL